MFVLGVNPTDLSGLGAAPAILLLLLALFGVLAMGVVAWIFVEERSLSDHFEFESGPVDRGTAVPCWCNDDALKGVASQHKVNGIPAKVEKKRRVGGRVKVPWVGGRADASSKTTHKPYDDKGELILQVLARLDEKGELNQTADQVHARGTMLEPFLTALSDGHEAAEAFFQRWLDKHYPDGVDGIDSAALAKELAAMQSEIPEERLSDELKAAHAALSAGDNSILLLEGEWQAEGNEENLLLKRTDLRIIAYNEAAPKSLPLPSGIAIHVRLDGELTRHGKNAMVGVTRPIRSSVVGTVRQYAPDTGCLEIAPIAVFQRFSSA